MSGKMRVNQYDRTFNPIKYIKETVDIVNVISRYTTLKPGAGGVLWGKCPLHDEETASFKITPRLKLFHCFGCGKHGDIYDFMLAHSNLNHQRTTEHFINTHLVPDFKFQNKAVPPQIKDLADESQKIKSIKIDEKNVIPQFNAERVWNLKSAIWMNISKIPEWYEYVYEDGIIAGYIYFGKDKKGKKLPIPISLSEKLTADGLDTEIVWAMVGLPTPRPIYNIKEVIENKGKKPILVVEGERCATAAREYLKDFVVVTWSGGANAAKQTDWSILESDEVFLWPDHDDTGHEAAQTIANQLLSSEILKIPSEKPKGWDVRDAIAEGKSPEALSEFILAHRVPKEPVPEYKFDFEMPPHLLGELTQYILDASLIPHPLLATGAALAILSILQAQKVVTEEHMPPNLYVVTLAPTGIGKNFPLNLVREIITQIGCKKLLAGFPVSGAGLVKALDKRLGRALVPIDEIGQKMQQILGSSDSYQKNIIELMLTLFSNSNSCYNEPEYSDRSKEVQQRVLNKPNLVIYGTGVPDDFYKSFTGEASLNGFLARLLVLEGVDITVKKKYPHEVVKEMPKPLFDKLCQLAVDPLNTAPAQNSDEIEKMGLNEYDFKPSVIPFVREAKKLMREFSDKCNQEAARYGRDEQSFKAGVYNRDYELASKIALISRGFGEVIDLKAAEFAISFVTQYRDLFRKKAEDYIYENDFDKEMKAIERYLRKQCNWVDKRTLLNRFRIKSKILQDVLDNLLEAGKIEERIKPSKKRVAIADKEHPLQWRMIPERNSLEI